jgi:hypothetical protein
VKLDLNCILHRFLSGILVLFFSDCSGADSSSCFVDAQNSGIVTARYMPSVTPCSVWGRNMLGMVSEGFV